MSRSLDLWVGLSEVDEIFVLDDDRRRMSIITCFVGLDTIITPTLETRIVFLARMTVFMV